MAAASVPPSNPAVTDGREGAPGRRPRHPWRLLTLLGAAASRRAWRPMDEHETELLAAAGLKPCRVLSRGPFTVAVARRAYVPGLLASILIFLVMHSHGAVTAIIAAEVAGPVFALSMVTHEIGHLLAARRVRGITPRVLLLRSYGGVSIVEGRYASAGGAALFAAGGLLASIVTSGVLFAAGDFLVAGPVAAGLVCAALLNVIVLAINLVPVAPSDGYLLLRAALWARSGSRSLANKRAARWSWWLLGLAVCGAVEIYTHDANAGGPLVLVLASLLAQNALALRRTRGH